MNFSQRNGYIKAREVIQKDDLDKITRTRIWNCFYELLYNFSKFPSSSLRFDDRSHIKNSFCSNYWKVFKNEAIHLMPINSDFWISEFEKIFFRYPINILFDFLEFLRDQQPITNLFQFKTLNKILEEEKVAYRFVNGIFIETESEAQIKQIEDLSNGLKTANLSRSENHFNEAFRNLYDRNNPNYKTSIIESIQFLECLINFKLNKGRGKRQLGDLLQDIKIFKQSDFELSVLEMFSKIYGKLSNNGIRHGASEFKEEFELLITPNFNQAKLIFNLAISLGSYLLTLELTKK